MKPANDASASPVSFSASVARLPRAGMPVSVQADDRQRAALAEIHGLQEVRAFAFDLLVSSWKRNGVKVEGRVTASIVQNCVVTLDPIDAEIDEPVSAVFLPADSRLGREGFEGGGEVHLDPDGPDSPETFTGTTIDVGALAEEFFALAIDPYPRKSGAVVEGGTIGDPDPEDWRRKLGSLLPRR